MGMVRPHLGSDSHSPPANPIDIPSDQGFRGNKNAKAKANVTDSLTYGINFRTPSRSFYHRSFNSSTDPAQYSSHGVREQTAELASFALSLPQNGYLPHNLDIFDHDRRLDDTVPIDGSSDDINAAVGSSTPSQPAGYSSDRLHSDRDENDGAGASASEPAAIASVAEDPTEQTSLLGIAQTKDGCYYGTTDDVEDPRPGGKRQRGIFSTASSNAIEHWRVLSSPSHWDGRAIWQLGIVYPASLFPAVFLGLLLNVLDALSYGMILFPLGEPIFASLGPDGISMYYVSTIIAQVIFSCGGSIFKGGVGSEMIEVVPFFHQMAFTILHRVGSNNPQSVLATCILSFSASSVLTGIVFFLLGACRLGSIVGFFPRHILVGCIGGVGFFLLKTGIEVSARLDSFGYDIPTLQKLFRLDNLFLWVIPLALAVGLLILRRFIHSNILVGAYFIAVAAVFYAVKFGTQIQMEVLRNSGWVFDAPSSSDPWYHFYTLYDFSLVDWAAFVDTIPAMFALTFFGLLHVPINVPALGISTGEDNLSVDRELIAHGVTNALSGLAGSVQNYLVYTNSLLFIDSGGNSRLAGLMLAAATASILVIGPVIIGFIPVMVVGALIFMLGIELMLEALADTWDKLHQLEYLTVVIIVVTMGTWDFVTGVFVGIILACVNYVVQSSRRSPIRATYSGNVAWSTVRRPPIQRRFLREAGQQTLVIKLASYLFFGTIVDVENTMRGLIEDEAFNRRPIRFLILDFSRVYGLDFSAAEAFTRINRILRKRGVQVVISGLNVESDVGRSLQNVGLFEAENEVQIFEDLNSALEFCENDYLKVFYSHREALLRKRGSAPSSLDVPKFQGRSYPTDGGLVSSPRNLYLQQVATSTIRENESALAAPAAWSAMRQPLPLILQTFQGLTLQNEDFWFPACAYFQRNSYAAGTVLYKEGDIPKAFYLLESGMLRAEYELPQGRYFELIVAGGPCGELPFFSETRRTATVKAEQDCVAWCLDATKWQELRQNQPRIAQELLTVGMKLTTERMDSITSYAFMVAA